MKIRTQFILTLLLFGLILIGMVGSLTFTNQQVDRLLQQEEIARRIEQGASELNYLSGDYLIYGESQQRARWESSFASFSEDISKLVPVNSEQQAMVAHIKADQSRLQAVFKNIVATLEESTQIAGAAPEQAFIQVSWSRMEVQNQGIAFEASLLSQQLHDEAEQLKQMNLILMFVLIGIFGAYLLTNHYLIDQRTLRSIAKLQAGTEIIGSGNLDFTIAVKREDEIGELSHAFNKMTVSLKEVTASKTDLEREIVERQRAEEALRKTNERLQEQTAELDAQAEELMVQTDELAAANKQLRESEQRYSTIFDKSPFAISLTKLPEGILVGVNNAFLELFEFTREEVIGKTTVDLRIADPDSHAQVMAEIRSHRSVKNFEVTRVTKTGSRHILSLNLDLVSIDGGEHILTTIRDVTERRRAEGQLARSNQKLNEILASIQDDFYVLDRDWKFVYASRLFTSKAGKEPEDFIGKNIWEMFPKHVGTDLEENFRAAMEKRETRRFEIGGKYAAAWYRMTAFPSAEGITVLGTDITESKRTEEALRQSEERFRLALTHAPVSVAIQDCDLRYTWAYNQKTRRVDEIVGKTDIELFPSEAAHLTDLKRRVLETGENLSEKLWLNSNDQRLFLNLFIEPLRNEMGEIDGVGLATVDLTQVKLAEEALREVNERLKAQAVEMEMQAQELQSARLAALNLMEDALDVQEQVKKINAMLRESEQRLNRAQEIAHLGSWELDLVNDCLSWSDEAYRIFGLQPQEFGATYEAFLEAVHPDDRAAVDEAYSSSINDGRDSYEIEHRVVRRSSGEVRIVHEKCEHFRDESGQIIRSVGMVHDITERKYAEEALRKARDELELRVQERTEELAIANEELIKEIAEREEIERQLRIQTTAMEAAANGIVITDCQGNIEWTNPALTQISGYEADEMIGQSMRLFRSGKHDADFYHQLWETILAGNVWQGETTNRRKDGNLYIEEQTITPVRNGNGQISHFIAIKQDVTERKLMYAQLEESNQELKLLSTSEHQQRLLAEGLVESSLVLNMNLELDSLLDHIFEQTRRTIPYIIADIVLIKDGVARVARQWGFEDHSEARTLLFEEGDLPIHQFPIWERICATGSAKLIPDTSLEPQWSPYFGMTWIRSYLAAPLIYSDQVIGIINLCSDQANAFHEGMANNLKAFAASAAVAIQNARLYEAEQHDRKVAEILSLASVALSQTLDIQRVMETILDYIQSVLPVDATFLILSEGEDQYRIRCVRASEEQSPVRTLLNQSIDLLNEPVVKPFFEKHTSTLIRDSHELEIWDPPTELAAMRSWLGIPLISTGKTIGMMVATNLQADFFSEDQVELAEAVVGQATVALQNAWLFEQVRSGRQRLQLLSRHLVEIQENERKYIARELHDETSQALTSLKIGLHSIEQAANGESTIVGQVAELRILADEVLESLHRLAMNLRPASLDHLGLVEALTSLVESTGQRSRIISRFKCLGIDQRNRLTDEIEASVYRIVQESLTNIIRHAHATSADVILEWQDEKIAIIVEDDGVGIDLTAARTDGQLGLVGMQERAEMLGGRLLIDSSPNAGTTLVVEIPYAHSNIDSR